MHPNKLRINFFFQKPNNDGFPVQVDKRIIILSGTALRTIVAQEFSGDTSESRIVESDIEFCPIDPPLLGIPGIDFGITIETSYTVARSINVEIRASRILARYRALEQIFETLGKREGYVHINLFESTYLSSIST
jgi:hypothetical protein